MNIQQEDNQQRGSFFIEDNGNRTAELAYTWRSEKLISIDHTEVDESLEGKGVGSMLVEHMVSFARTNKIKLKLYCSFAKKVFERHHEYADVLLDQ